jgi:hypothetical protein
MILGTLRTHILEDHDTKEGGFFSLEVTIDEGLMQRSGDVKAFAYRQVAAYLSSAILDTRSSARPLDLRVRRSPAPPLRLS